ncbi:MAG: GNAT family N-acetyltransferase [Actinobacteria bacterium]|nr:GNAT family N-acetyltransferase [Actinomycetota bacterium]
MLGIQVSSILGEVLISIVVASITATIIFTVKSSRNAYRRSRIHKKYPVGGDYISYYEDEMHGQISIVKAPLHLEQRGEKIKGRSKSIGPPDKGGDREYIFEGDILETGYISGVYHNASISDPEIGTFFMEPDPTMKNVYNGIWAGYDSINRKVVSGTYLWRKETKIDIGLISPDDDKDISFALATLGSSLGERYIEPSLLKKFVESRDGSIAIQASVQGEFAGVLLARVLSPPEVLAYHDLIREAGSSQQLCMHKVGLINSCAIRNNYRRQGIGTALTTEAIKRLSGLGCTAIMVISWGSDDSDSIRGILEAMNFKKIANIEKYWREDSIKRDYSCPKCGNPCNCTANIYINEL